jgi:hypothetical protein
MSKKLIATICATVLTSAAFAQTNQPAGTEAAWVGEITAANVYVRSSADDAAYPCLQMSAPAKVTVVGKSGTWLKILPPPDAFSVIAKGFVTPDPSSTRGTVTGNNVRVRAGTRLLDSNRLIDHYVVQLTLNKGDQVAIVGQAEEFYKITPPKGAFLYVSEKYIKQPLLTDVPEVVGAVTTRPVATEEQPVVTEKTTPEAKATLAAFEALEAKLKAEFKKPVDVRDLQGLLDEYRALDAGEKGFLKPYLNARIQFLQASIERMKELRSLEDALSETAAKQRQFELGRTRIEVVPTTKPVTTFTARGILLPSALFPGTAGAPKRFIVRDPDTLRITAYAQCTSGQVNLSQYAGKEVALLGNAEYNTQLDAEVVEVQQVVVLREQVQLPGPPEPVVKPYTPPPRPKPPAPLQRPQISKLTTGPAAPPEAMPETKPAEPAEKPAAEPELPALKPAEPAEKPAAEPELPALKPAEPAEKPAAEPELPALKPAEPAEKPATEPELPALKPAEPAEKPATEPELPALKPAEPAEKPAAEPELPALKPAEPAEKPAAEPQPKPVRPELEPLPEPTTRAAGAPLPPTGLPVIVPARRPTTQPVNENEFE